MSYKFIQAVIPTVLWGLMLTMLALEKVSLTVCYCCTSLFVNNSVDTSMAGAINGVTYTLAGALRSFAPSLGGAAFAWSITSGKKIGFPFDVHLAFILFGLVYLASNILCAYLPPQLEQGRKREVVPEVVIVVEDEKDEQHHSADVNELNQRSARL